MPLAQGALVGREVERARVDGVLDRVGEGLFAAIAVVGPPGIGKSSLLADLARKADDRRWLAVGGTSSELDSHAPFAAFVDALDAYLGSAPAGRFDALGMEVLDEVASVFRSLDRTPRPARRTEPSERFRTNRAVRSLLEVLAADRPVVIVLDDVHWGDPASVDLVATLLSKPPLAPILLALGMRVGQMSPRLATTLDRAVRAGGIDRVDLDTLTRPDIERMLGGDFTRAEVDRIYDESGGNPFYARQLASAATRSASGGGSVPLNALADPDVPPMVAAALAEELELLSDASRLVVNGAAVAGEPFDPELVASAAGIDVTDVLEALDEPLRLDIIRTTGIPRRFRFRHPLVRRAVYDSTPHAWRLRAHERCADALVRRGAPATMRAAHVERAGRRGSEEAVHTLREAGDAAMSHAPASAARWFDLALQFLPVAADKDERVALLTKRARALAASGRFDESRSALIECIDLVPLTDSARRVQLVAECASVEHQLGRHVDAHERMSRALDAVTGRDSAEAVSLMISLAVDSLYAGDYSALHRLLSSVFEAADEASDHGFTAAAQAVQALATAMEGTIGPAVERCEEAAGLIDSMTDEQLAARLDGIVHLTTAEMYVDRFEASLRHAERAVRIGRATGQLDLYPLIFPMLGTALWVRGRVQESGEVLDGAIEAARLTGNVQAIAWNLFNRCEAHLAGGEIRAALDAATESAALLDTLDDSAVSAAGSGSLLSALAESDQPERALEVVRTLCGGLDAPLIGGTWRVHRLEIVTRCLVATGDLVEAARVATLAQELATSFGLLMPTGMACLALGSVALACGDSPAAVVHGRHAVAALDEVGMVGETGRAWLFTGRALGAAGQVDEASTTFERAIEIFSEIGNTRRCGEIDQELRRLGRKVHRRTNPGERVPFGLGSLTERERQIAALIVDRRTNGEIAAELFLSTKTIETHVRNIFRKLDVGSRVDVARMIERAS
jgi:DNA-binding CsgD family transcriptional regulator